MKIRFSLILALIASLSSCIDPLELKMQTGLPQLVVDGMITTEPGPYAVKLSRSEPYTAYSGGRSAAETGATVILSDDQGKRETLVETTPGVYKTRAGGLQGQIGHTYSLTIKTRGGKEYASQPELLASVPEIDTLYWEVRAEKILNTSGNEQVVYFLAVYVDSRDPAAARNYYMWQWEGIYRVNAQPWDHKIKVRGEWVPAPKDCCQTCWITDFTNSINVQDDRLINGNSHKRYLVTRVPINERTFESKYHLEVKQLSVSEAAYDYWSMVKTQVFNVGNIQDPPPAIIVGNIINVQDPKDKPLGFFGASAVVKKSIFVKREELGFNPGEMVFPDDCRVLTNSTTDKPTHW